MDWSSGLSWLSTLAARRAQRFAETDRGDMGTAFGLDASMVALDALPGPQPLGQERWERRVIRRSDL